MNVFWLLVLAHLLADFTLQTSSIIIWKRRNILGGFIHSGIFLACSFVLCFNYLSSPWVNLGNAFIIEGWIAIILLTVLHFLEDEWRIWSIQKKNAPDSLLFFLWDQFIHLIFIFVVFPVDNTVHSQSIWIILAIILILLTHFTSIFIYFIEKSFQGYARLERREKYILMIERMATGFVLMIPGFLAYIVLLFWLGRVFFINFRKDREFSMFNVVLGNIMAICLGLMARAIYY